MRALQTHPVRTEDAADVTWLWWASGRAGHGTVDVGRVGCVGQVGGVRTPADYVRAAPADGDTVAPTEDTSVCGLPALHRWSSPQGAQRWRGR